MLGLVAAGVVYQVKEKTDFKAIVVYTEDGFTVGRAPVDKTATRGIRRHWSW